MSLRSEPYPHGSKTNNGSGLVLVAKRGGKSREEDILCRPMWASLVAILDDSRVATHLCYTIGSGVRQKGALRPKLGKGSQVLGWRCGPSVWPSDDKLRGSFFRVNCKKFYPSCYGDRSSAVRSPLYSSLMPSRYSNLSPEAEHTLARCFLKFDQLWRGLWDLSACADMMWPH